MVDGLPRAVDVVVAPAAASFPPDPSSPAAARRWLRTQVVNATGAERPILAGRSTLTDSPGTATLSCGAADVLETAQLLLTEVVTNAVVHAGSAAAVRVEVSPGRLKVEVQDRSPALPLQDPGSQVDPLATSGRGLELLDLLSDSWGWRREGEGKVVWFVLQDRSGLTPFPSGVAGRGPVGARSAAGDPSGPAAGLG